MKIFYSREIIFLIVFILILLSTNAQVVRVENSNYYSISDGVNYISLYKSLKRNYSSNVFNGLVDSINYYSDVIQKLTFIGENKVIDSIYHLSYSKRSKVESFMWTYNTVVKDLISIDSIIYINRNNKVVIMNDDHARVESRAHFLHLLHKFRELGFNHLAMEALGDAFPSYYPMNLGYYFQEPLMAEIYREAKDLGFHFITYEDTISNFYSSEARDSIQALNLYNSILKLKDSDKVLVFSGQLHLAEDCPFINTFGKYFKKFSGIDPITIDQTKGLRNIFQPDIHFLMDSSYGIVISDSTDIKSKIGFSNVDYYYIYPPTKYDQCQRPSWLSCEGTRKRVEIKNNDKALMLQAYYKNEIKDSTYFNFVTPADQVIVHQDNQNQNLYLRRRFEYYIVARDSLNNIISSACILVN